MSIPTTYRGLAVPGFLASPRHAHFFRVSDAARTKIERRRSENAP